MATLARLQRDSKLERLTAGADHFLILAALSLLPDTRLLNPHGLTLNARRMWPGITDDDSRQN